MQFTILPVSYMKCRPSVTQERISCWGFLRDSGIGDIVVKYAALLYFIERTSSTKYIRFHEFV